MTIDATDLAGFQGTIELAAGLELIAADYTGTGAMNLDYAAQGQIAVCPSRWYRNPRGTCYGSW